VRTAMLLGRAAWFVTLFASIAFARDVTVSARVELLNGTTHGKRRQSGDVVFWLTPAGTTSVPTHVDSGKITPLRLTQHNKSFDPHLLVIPVGSLVEFPNRDPFFHNVFSLFDGKRFDLGLYEAGNTRKVRFDKPGISYIFCNIHAEMSAVVVALATPYYGVSDQRGEVIIPRVPAGRYTLNVWYETALAETLNSLNREVTISDDNPSLGVFRIRAAALPAEHKNKYGNDYDPPTPDNPAYNRR
jgi:plastocyanin